ncbi:MAG TPA: hypothetical protein VKY70_05010 [Pseudomonas sp.]|jgi:predicted RNA-binding Zn-ribbon protein involved in translation (DUF1610 family)|nr:hypothetical protein [Pseudomonas sp.]
MQCFICDAEAGSVPSVDGGERVSCPACGDYRITRAARSQLADGRNRLDAEVTRIWLKGRLCTGQLPVIDWAQVSILTTPAR